MLASKPLNLPPGDRLLLLSAIANSSAQDIIAHNQWDIIANDPGLAFELIREGNFPYIDKLNPALFSSLPLSLAIFNSSQPDIRVVPEKFLKNSQFIMQVLEQNFFHITVIPQKFWNKKEIIEWFCFRYRLEDPLKYIPEEYRDDFDLANTLLPYKGTHYSYLSYNLKNNAQLFERATAHYSVHLIFPLAGDVIRNNPDYAIQAISSSAKMYEYVSKDLRSSAEFFLNLLPTTPDLLEYADSSIQDNEQCVWESTKLYPDTLQFSSYRLLETPSFCVQVCEDMDIDAIEKSFKYWDAKIRGNKEVILQLLPKLSLANCWEYLENELLNEQQFILDILVVDSKIMNYIGRDLGTNSQFFIEAHKIINQSQGGRGLYESNSKQSLIFDKIPNEAANNAQFLLDLYEYFDNIFITIIYPKIQHFEGPVMSLLEEAKKQPNGIYNFMQKMKLKNVLDKELITHNHHKVHKI